MNDYITFRKKFIDLILGHTIGLLCCFALVWLILEPAFIQPKEASSNFYYGWLKEIIFGTVIIFLWLYISLRRLPSLFLKFDNNGIYYLYYTGFRFVPWTDINEIKLNKSAYLKLISS